MDNEGKQLYEEGLTNGFKFGFLIGVITYIVTFEVLWFLTH